MTTTVRANGGWYYAKAGAALLAQDGVHPAADMLRACLSQRNLILNASAVLWRREALRQALDRCGAELDRFTMAGDWWVYAEVLSAGGSVAYVAEPLNMHRRHEASVTHRLTPRRHMAEVSRMHRHMRGLLGSDPALVAGQRQALRDVQAALKLASAPSPSGRGSSYSLDRQSTTRRALPRLRSMPPGGRT